MISKHRVVTCECAVDCTIYRVACTSRINDLNLILFYSREERWINFLSAKQTSVFSPPRSPAGGKARGINVHDSLIRAAFLPYAESVVHEILTRVVTLGVAFRGVKITRSIIADHGSKSRAVEAKVNIIFNGKLSGAIYSATCARCSLARPAGRLQHEPARPRGEGIRVATLYT